MIAGKEVHIIGDHIVSPLGWSTAENFGALVRNEVALKHFPADRSIPFDHISGIMDDLEIDQKFTPLGDVNRYTKLEKMCIYSMQHAMTSSGIEASSDRVGLIVSTTKGNIDLLLKDSASAEDRERTYLSVFAQTLSDYFGFSKRPIVISNACISGVVALITARRLILADVYDHIVVVGADLVTPFTLSGFNSLKALSPKHCQPFDKDRSGINLGEAVATVIVSNTKNPKLPIRILDGHTSNDANHISGPSRTGEGMRSVIRDTIHGYNKKIDFISAHGTATLYNDEMEALAIDEEGLSHVPVHSLKGYYGHTLGAAGVLESIIGYHSILNNKLIKSMGISELGTTRTIQVITENEEIELQNCLKTSSGFGGCNAAILFEQHT